MKKVLFATTALVASAGIASAEMTVSGSAEMGIIGGDNTDTQFHNDFTIKFVGSGETDGGLTFGLLIELEESNGGDEINGSASYDNEAVFISGDFGTLTLGETDGAFDKRLKEVALAGGTIIDNETGHAGYNGNSGLDGYNDNQILRYDYEFGEFGLSLSMEQDDDGAGDDDVYGIGLSYTAEFTGVEMTFGLGYQTGDWDLIDFDYDDNGVIDNVAEAYGTADIIGLSIVADFGNGFSLGFNYSTLDADVDFSTGGDADDFDWDHYGIGIAYEMDAWTFAANYGKYEADIKDCWAGPPCDNDSADAEGYGLLVNYDLGGGAVIQAGYGHSDNFDGTDSDDWSLGVAMSF